MWSYFKIVLSAWLTESFESSFLAFYENSFVFTTAEVNLAETGLYKKLKKYREENIVGYQQQ